MNFCLTLVRSCRIYSFLLLGILSIIFSCYSASALSVFNSDKRPDTREYLGLTDISVTSGQEKHASCLNKKSFLNDDQQADIQESYDSNNSRHGKAYKLLQWVKEHKCITCGIGVFAGVGALVLSLPLLAAYVHHSLSPENDGVSSSTVIPSLTDDDGVSSSTVITSAHYIEIPPIANHYENNKNKCFNYTENASYIRNGLSAKDITLTSDSSCLSDASKNYDNDGRLQVKVDSSNREEAPEGHESLGPFHDEGIMERKRNYNKQRIDIRGQRFDSATCNNEISVDKEALELNRELHWHRGHITNSWEKLAKNARTLVCPFEYVENEKGEFPGSFEKSAQWYEGTDPSMKYRSQDRPMISPYVSKFMDGNLRCEYIPKNDRLEGFSIRPLSFHKPIWNMEICKDSANYTNPDAEPAFPPGSNATVSPGSSVLNNIDRKFWVSTTGFREFVAENRTSLFKRTRVRVPVSWCSVTKHLGECRKVLSHLECSNNNLEHTVDTLRGYILPDWIVPPNSSSHTMSTRFANYTKNGISACDNLKNTFQLFVDTLRESQHSAFYIQRLVGSLVNYANEEMSAIKISYSYGVPNCMFDKKNIKVYDDLLYDYYGAQSRFSTMKYIHNANIYNVRNVAHSMGINELSSLGNNYMSHVVDYLSAAQSSTQVETAMSFLDALVSNIVQTPFEGDTLGSTLSFVYDAVSTSLANENTTSDINHGLDSNSSINDTNLRHDRIFSNNTEARIKSEMKHGYQPCIKNLALQRSVKTQCLYDIESILKCISTLPQYKNVSSEIDRLSNHSMTLRAEEKESFEDEGRRHNHTFFDYEDFYLNAINDRREAWGWDTRIKRDIDTQKYVKTTKQDNNTKTQQKGSTVLSSSSSNHNAGNGIPVALTALSAWMCADFDASENNHIIKPDSYFKDHSDENHKGKKQDGKSHSNSTICRDDILTWKEHNQIISAKMEDCFSESPDLQTEYCLTITDIIKNTHVKIKDFRDFIHKHSYVLWKEVNNDNTQKNNFIDKYTNARKLELEPYASIYDDLQLLSVDLYPDDSTASLIRTLNKISENHGEVWLADALESNACYLKPLHKWLHKQYAVPDGFEKMQILSQLDITVVEKTTECGKCIHLHSVNPKDRLLLKEHCREKRISSECFALTPQISDLIYCLYCVFPVEMKICKKIIPLNYQDDCWAVDNYLDTLLQEDSDITKHLFVIIMRQLLVCKDITVIKGQSLRTISSDIFVEHQHTLNKMNNLMSTNVMQSGMSNHTWYAACKNIANEFAMYFKKSDCDSDICPPLQDDEIDAFVFLNNEEYLDGNLRRGLLELELIRTKRTAMDVHL
ncbi:MAG: hypothetical protein QS748_04100 [Candidatus Endonucleobacter bathymodioli]|uniref:Uncharacterized protein n=1 Tax=Candidatus Endonucleibacter bathymodioli TaxID=539814 RepID=A0AA90NK63_9GAMM|nr:hypothetical protein [Candidatus Endonucleobacter bathymodioli]